MNNTNEISPNNRFHVNTKNIFTSEDGTTIEIVDHELLIEQIPEDVDNENMLTVDAFNRVYKKEISSLPVPQTDRHSIPNATSLNNNVNAQVDINNTIGSISSIVLDASAGQYPKFTMSDKNQGGSQNTSFLVWGAYNQTDGTFTASDTQYVLFERKHGTNKFIIFGSSTASPQTAGVAVSSFVQIAEFSTDDIILQRPTTTDILTVNNKLGINISPTAGSPLGILKLSNLSSPAPNWGTRAHWYISDEGAGGTRPFLTINASRNYDQSITWGSYWSGTAWTSSDSLDSFKWQRNFDKMFFGVSVGAQVGGTPVTEKLPLYIKANSNIGFYVDGAQDGGLYLLSPDVSTSNNIMLSHNSITKKTEIIDRVNIWGQNLAVTDDVQFTELTISNPSPPVTIGYDTVKFIKPESFTSGNWGARQSFYLDNIGALESTLPHFGLALSARNDQNISFSQYFTQEAPFGWKYSETNQDTCRVHFQDYAGPNPRGLNFYMNKAQGVAGALVSEEAVMSMQSNIYGLGLHIAPINSNSALYIDNITIDNTNTRFLTLEPLTGKVQESILPAIGGGDVSWIGGLSVDNSVARYDSTTGLIIQGSGVTIDDFDSVLTGGTITAFTQTLDPEFDAEWVLVKESNDTFKKVALNDLFLQSLSPSSSPTFATVNTGQGAHELYNMDQDVTTTSTVTHFNVLVDNSILCDNIAERTALSGVMIEDWTIKPNSIISNGSASVTNPLQVRLKFNATDRATVSLYGQDFNNNGILFDMDHVPAGTNDTFISGSNDANIFINKNGGNLDFLIDNGNLPNTAVSKASMTKTMSISKTSIELNQTVTCGQAVVLSNIPTDPATQPQTVLITQSTLTDELFRRPYFPVYGDAVNTATPVVALPVIGSYVLIPANYAGVFLKNCTVPIGNAIILDAGLDSFMCRVSYSVCVSSGTALDTEYEFAIIANSFNITASQKSVILVDNGERVNVSCTFLYFASALDDISLFIRNNTSTQSASIESMTLSISKIFE